MNIKLRTACWLLMASASFAACKRRPPVEEEEQPKGITLADTGFRPSQNGFGFRNEGGRYPKTPPVLTKAGVVTLFGKGACLGGETAGCKLTPVASEWMAGVNRAMNGGQCEGMAVASAAFFKKIHDPATFKSGVASAHDLTHDSVSPLIGYYWAYQMVNPVKSVEIKSRITQTPNDVEDSLVEMMKRGELATIGIYSRRQGHAVTPYAVEDRGNGVHWIRIYDNNYPNDERYITIDRNANTWKYQAAINANVPGALWEGSPETHSITVNPLSTRLSTAECPFCAGSGKKVIIASGRNAVSLTDQDGRKLGRDGERVVNEIPGAEVVQPNSYLDGAPVGEPMYVVPADADYDVHVHGQEGKHAEAHPDEDHGVSVLGNGSAVAVETPRLKNGEKDTLSLHRDGGVKYHSGTGGTIPPIRLAHDGGSSGMHTRIANMKVDAHDELKLKVDHHAGTVTVAGGGKKSDSYDLKVKHVHAGAEDHEVEQKGIKFTPGQSHTVHTDPKPGAKAAPLKIKSAPYVPKAKPAKAENHAKDAAKPAAKPAPAPKAPRKR